MIDLDREPPTQKEAMKAAVEAWTRWEPPQAALEAPYGVLRAAFIGGYLAAVKPKPELPF